MNYERVAMRPIVDRMAHAGKLKTYLPLRSVTEICSLRQKGLSYWAVSVSIPITQFFCMILDGEFMKCPHLLQFLVRDDEYIFLVTVFPEFQQVIPPRSVGHFTIEEKTRLQHGHIFSLNRIYTTLGPAYNEFGYYEYSGWTSYNE